jgi:hypothetical protein
VESGQTLLDKNNLIASETFVSRLCFQVTPQADNLNTRLAFRMVRCGQCVRWHTPAQLDDVPFVLESKLDWSSATRLQVRPDALKLRPTPSPAAHYFRSDDLWSSLALPWCPLVVALFDRRRCRLTRR